MATTLLIGLNAQSAILDYMKANLLHLFLPLGLLMRSFYFTRGAGALLMSMGLCMYFVFPIVFLLLDPGFTPAPPPSPDTRSIPQQQCYQTMSSTAQMLRLAQGSAINPISAQPSLDSTDLSKSYISLMLHPLVALFVTIAIMRYVMSILGGDTFEVLKFIGKMV